MNRHKGKDACMKARAAKGTCRCLVAEEGAVFWVCCGDWCRKCGGWRNPNAREPEGSAGVQRE